MPQGVTTDNSVLAILKEYYGVQDVEGLVFRNSPVLGMIKKERVGGKYVPLPMAVYGSGAVTADYNKVIAQAVNGNMNVAMQLVPGQLFSSFVVGAKEFLASQGDRAAFISVFAIRAMLAMDDLRKVLATCLYRSGFLEMGPVVTLDTSYLYVDVDSSTAMAISPQSEIMFAATTASAYRSANPVIVSTIETVQSSGLTRITFTSPYAATVAVGDQLMINGGRDNNLQPNALIGLEGWLPTVANRTGAPWATYVNVPFFNLNRSSAPDRLCGRFVLQAAGETRTQALLRLIKDIRKQGGVPDLIIVNDEVFAALANEVLAQRSLLQSIDIGGGVGKKNTASQGITQIDMQFSTNWISKVYDDPYCPKEVAYVLDSNTIRLFGISNPSKIMDKLPFDNQPGGPEVTKGEAELSTQFQFLVDDMYSVHDVTLTSGPGFRIDFILYGNFALINPAHNGVCKFAA